MKDQSVINVSRNIGNVVWEGGKPNCDHFVYFPQIAAQWSSKPVNDSLRPIIDEFKRDAKREYFVPPNWTPHTTAEHKGDQGDFSIPAQAEGALFGGLAAVEAESQVNSAQMFSRVIERVGRTIDCSLRWQQCMGSHQGPHHDGRISSHQWFVLLAKQCQCNQMKEKKSKR